MKLTSRCILSLLFLSGCLRTSGELKDEPSKPSVQLGEGASEAGGTSTAGHMAAGAGTGLTAYPEAGLGALGLAGVDMMGSGGQMGGTAGAAAGGGTPYLDAGFEVAGETQPEGACLGSQDATLLSMGQISVQELVTGCDNECLFIDSATVCSDCLNTKKGLSLDCSGCYGRFLLCMSDHCFLDCIDPSLAACQLCGDTHCVAAFSACSGLGLPLLIE